MKKPESNVIGEAVRRIREQRGWSQNKLARELGVALNTVQAIEEGRTRKSKYLPDLSRILEVPLDEIDPNQKVTTPATIPVRALVAGHDLPVYGTTDAGGGVLVLSSEPVDREDRPRSVENVRDAYGVIVTGDSMFPVVRSGDIVVVHPHRPPRAGDLCIFRNEQHGEFRSLLKEYVGQAGDVWKVKRYHPREQPIELKRLEWPECHVVVVIHRR